ncbi:MAG TPA: methyltransferase domain-containing protein [Gemmataceae bacterium]|nr:methyltransferase domain-containing protein [Gemmataceae bacterium]
MHAGDLTNQQMVDRLIAQGALWTPALIAAFRATPRHRFLDHVYLYHQKSERWRKLATRNPGPEGLRLLYSDRALVTRLSPANAPAARLPISSSSQPSLMAQMLEDLAPAAGHRVLEVGAGTGYNAALLAHVAGPGQVVSLDVDRAVLAGAARHLRPFAGRQVCLRHADGRAGWPEAAPYDRLMVTAATDDLEPAWLGQMAPGGVLVAPLAVAPGLAFVVCGRVTGGVFHGRLTRPAYFMRLRGEGEAGEEGPKPALGLLGEELLGRGALKQAAAPWAGWFERRRTRPGWLYFVQALAFFGWLRGLRLAYQVLPDGRPTFAVADAARGCLCWLGPTAWQVSGDAGRALGAELWQAFLDAGGPWPTEFRLTATPHGGETADRRGGYFRQGPRCRQTWELTEPRQRGGWPF